MTITQAADEADRLDKNVLIRLDKDNRVARVLFVVDRRVLEFDGPGCAMREAVISEVDLRSDSWEVRGRY